MTIEDITMHVSSCPKVSVVKTTDGNNEINMGDYDFSFEEDRQRLCEYLGEQEVFDVYPIEQHKLQITYLEE